MCERHGEAVQPAPLQTHFPFAILRRLKWTLRASLYHLPKLRRTTICMLRPIPLHQQAPQAVFRARCLNTTFLGRFARNHTSFRLKSSHRGVGWTVVGWGCTRPCQKIIITWPYRAIYQRLLRIRCMGTKTSFNHHPPYHLMPHLISPPADLK